MKLIHGDCLEELPKLPDNSIDLILTDPPYYKVKNEGWDYLCKGRHVCEKPLDLLSHIITASSRPGDMILDCFGGSGNVGKAASRLNRRSMIIKKSQAWCDKICRR